MIAEHTFDCLQLQVVAHRGRGAVRIYVLNVGRREPTVLQCRFHRAVCTIVAFGRGGDVMGIAGHAVTRHFGVDPRTAFFRVLEFF